MSESGEVRIQKESGVREEGREWPFRGMRGREREREGDKKGERERVRETREVTEKSI